MSESDAVLIASMGYCLTWEITGARANQHWQGIRDYIAGSATLSDMDRWVCELYEESSPTAQEERSILSRIEERLDSPQRAASFRNAILSILPVPLTDAALKHRLMNSLTSVEDYGRIRSWLIEHKLASFRPTPKYRVPLAEREADFIRFIEHPYFLEGFRRFWHAKPKKRNNKQMRVLLCASAALSQLITCHEASEVREWARRLGLIGSYSEQTQEDVSSLCLEMLDESYDAQELAYRILVDAREVDRRNLEIFCERYADELSDFAQDLVRGIHLTD